MLVTAEPPGTAGVDLRPRRAWYLANGIVTVVFSGYCVITLIGLLISGLTTEQVGLAVLCTGALLAIQLLYFGRPATELRSALSHGMLLAQALVAYLPLLVFGPAWVGQPGIVAGSVLLVLRPVLAWPAFAAVVASMGVIQEVLTSQPIDVAYTTIATALTGLEFYLLTRLARLVSELHAARAELAGGAVAEERLRFARDLHDLLGLNLSAIALKGELTRRLVRKSPERARRELEEITGIARRALADVRSVASGYRELSLEGEARIARSLLAASDVDVRLNLAQLDLPAQTRTVLATALREGVTNALRRNGVQHCEIAVREAGGSVLLDIVHDGVERDSAEPDDDLAKPGFGKLADRVTALGGRLTAETVPSGRFRLHVDIPLRGQTQDRAARLPRHDVARSASLGGQLARNLVIAVLCGMALAAFVHVLYETKDPMEIGLNSLCLAALLALQLFHFSRPTGRPDLRLLAVQAALVYVPILELREHWVSLAGFLAGSALLALRPAFGWPAFVAVVASAGGIALYFNEPTVGVTFKTLATVNTGLIVFGLSWLIRLANEMDATRLRLAEMAVSEERLRLARDLHDLLGLSLSAIALKTELTDRVLLADPDRAATELQEILDLSRQALGDVRSVASGHRELSLEQESRSAEAVLTAADVQVQMDVQHADDLPGSVCTALAVVMREGVTNVLRHSKVEHCEIAVHQTARAVYLDIVNDGVQPEGAPARKGAQSETKGNGIRNLSDRLTALGGELTAGLDPDGRFRLRACVPVTVVVTVAG